MKHDEFYQLNISPITETTGALINIHVTDKDGIFAKLPTYIGHDFCPTPNELLIENGLIDDKVYQITTIEETAFSHCRNLRTLRIGKSVETIKWNMYKCVSLMDIIVDTENTNFYDIDGVLFKEKELIAFPQGRTGTYIIPNGIKKIGKHAFKSCSLSSIVFPDTLQEIGINAFYECNNITEFILPKSIRRIHSNKNVGSKPFTQRFYLSSDVNRSKPLSISDVIKMFPE